ncbi:MAG TPA: hypothetical protein VNL13_00800 [Sulfolobales archaeon]|nr:hypothetical protein [Sulfolobales archaeon]
MVINCQDILYRVPAANPSELVIRILLRLSEGTSVYRVVEGFLVLFSLTVIFIVGTILNTPWLLIVFALISIYGSYHLKRCRNLYQGYLWGIEGSGYRLSNRAIYLGIIGSIVAVEILMISGGLAIIITSMLGIGAGIARSIAIAIILSFAIVAVIGHFTRVRLYRIFISYIKGV